MISPKLFEILKERTEHGQAAVYKLIAQRRKTLRFAVSKEEAALVVAAEAGIDISKYASRSEIAPIRRFLTPAPPAESRPAPKEPGKAPTIRAKAKLPSGATIGSPFLPPVKVAEAVRMADAYVTLYLFENSLRSLVMTGLGTKHGSDWWSLKVPGKIQDKARERMVAEGEDRWHGQRGAHPIFYIDLGDLVKVVVASWEDLKDYIGQDQAWMQVKLKEIGLSRNIVAHHNPLADRDFSRVLLYFEDWIRQVRIPPPKTA